MRGLDPRIHPSSQESFSKKMDGRVKPGHGASISDGPGSAQQREERCSASGTRLLRLLRKGPAEWMGGINADNAKFAGEEFQFLQRKRKVLVVRVAVDVGIKLRCEEIAVGSGIRSACPDAAGLSKRRYNSRSPRFPALC
jgi:hypothetical protein